MKRTPLSAFALMLLAAFAGSRAIAQSVFDSLAIHFDERTRAGVVEKLYVDTDQTFYLVGETLWFSIFSVDGILHRPLSLSAVAYVEILDAQSNTILQGKVAMKEGRGDGSFYLPATLPTGNYVLRAYTRWMRNDLPDYYFHQRITIVNPFISPEKTNPGNERQSLVVSFFPEGGHLVEGIRSRLAFRITDVYGRGTNAKGSILNGNNDTIARFTTGKFGIGSFDFTPGEASYRAIVTDAKGQSTLHALPAVMHEGVAMRLEDQGSNVVITVQGAFDNERYSYVSLLGHSRQRIFFRNVQTWDRRKAIFIIPARDIPGGIAHFTVFDEDGSPLCERLYYKFDNNRLDIRATMSDPTPGPRAKVTITIDTQREDGTAVPANLSVAVAKNDSLENFPSLPIHPYLNLSSDLTGEIESPDYYFGTDQQATRADIDHLMLTHGWRRFKWDDLKSEPVLKYTPEFRGHIIEASVRGDDKPVAGQLAFLASPSKIISLYASRSDQDGKLLFETLPFSGTRKLLIQPAPGGIASQIELINPFSNKFAPYNPRPWSFPSSLEHSLLNRSIAMQVEDIFDDELNESQGEPSEDTTAFYGSPDERYFLDDYTRFPVMEEVMREYVPGVMVRKRDREFHFLVVDRINRGVLESPTILLDGVPVFHADRIMSLDPLKVRKLDVIGRKYYLGPAILNGIVSYSTYNGDFAGLEPIPGSLDINYEMLQQKRVFHHPTYATQGEVLSRLPDRRYLLYWDPQICTATNGRAEISFYTSDIKGLFDIRIEGLTADGRAGSAVYRFEVK